MSYQTASTTASVASPATGRMHARRACTCDQNLSIASLTDARTHSQSLRPLSHHTLHACHHSATAAGHGPAAAAARWCSGTPMPGAAAAASAAAAAAAAAIAAATAAASASAGAAEQPSAAACSGSAAAAASGSAAGASAMTTSCAAAAAAPAAAGAGAAAAGVAAAAAAAAPAGASQRRRLVSLSSAMTTMLPRVSVPSGHSTRSCPGRLHTSAALAALRPASSASCPGVQPLPGCRMSGSCCRSAGQARDGAIEAAGRQGGRGVRQRGTLQHKSLWAPCSSQGVQHADDSRRRRFPPCSRRPQSRCAACVRMQPARRPAAPPGSAAARRSG